MILFIRMALRHIYRIWIADVIGELGNEDLLRSIFLLYEVKYNQNSSIDKGPRMARYSEKIY